MKLTKIIALLLALMMCIIPLTSCDVLDQIFGGTDDDGGDNGDDGGNENDDTKLNGKTAQQAYLEMCAAFNSSTNYTTSTVQDITMVISIMGQTQTQEQRQTIIAKLCGEDQYMKTEAPSNNMEIYYVDGVMYTTTEGVKAKATISLDAYMEHYGMGNTAETMFPEFSAETLEDLVFKKSGEYYTVDFSMTGTEYVAIVGDMFSDSLGGEVEYRTVEYKLYFDADGVLKKYDCTLDYSIEISGVTVDATAVSVSEVTLGNVTEILPPDDASSYIDVTDALNKEIFG